LGKSDDLANLLSSNLNTSDDFTNQVIKDSSDIVNELLKGKTGDELKSLVAAYTGADISKYETYSDTDLKDEMALFLKSKA
jgi:hypothetical protein